MKILKKIKKNYLILIDSGSIHQMVNIYLIIYISFNKFLEILVVI